MSISSTDRVAGPYAGNGVATAFPFDFKVFERSDVLVAFVSAAGVASTLVLDSDYTVTLNADQDVEPGGTVTLSAPLATGATLTVTSQVPATQPVVLTNLGAFLPAVINGALDRLTILIQQAQGLFSRALALPASETGGNASIPGTAERAGKFLAFDELGRPTVAVPVVDSAADVRVDLASAASGKGAEMVSFDWAGLVTADGKVNYGIQTAANAVNVLRFIPPALWPAILNHTSTVDLTAYLQAARNATYNKKLFFPAGRFNHTGITFDPEQSVHWVGSAYDINGNVGTLLRNTGTADSISINKVGGGNDVAFIFECLALNATPASGWGIKATNCHGLRCKLLYIVNHGAGGVSLDLGWSNKFEHCIIAQNYGTGISLVNQCNNVTIDKCIVNSNGRTSGSNIVCNAPVAAENLNINILNTDFSYVGNAAGSNLQVTNTWGLNLTGSYTEGGASTQLVYVGANTKNVCLHGNYFQDGDVTIDSGDAHVVKGNTFRVNTVATRLVAVTPDGSAFEIGPNSYVNGATAVYGGGAGASHVTYGTAPPSSGNFARGSIRWNTAPTDGNGGSPVAGWICTTAGAPGTWTIFGGQAAAQSDSVATTVSGLVSDFNLLVAKLRASGIVKT